MHFVLDSRSNSSVRKRTLLFSPKTVIIGVVSGIIGVFAVGIVIFLVILYLRNKKPDSSDANNT